VNPQEIIAEIIDHLRGMWRFRWITAAVGWVMCLVGWAYVYTMPDIYKASAKVYVDTNSLLRPLMQGLTAQRDPLDDVMVVSRALLTRPNLEQVAHETDLSLRARTPKDLENLVTNLQQRIVIAGGRDQVFTIEYQDPSRQKAEEVVAAILNRFVEDALGTQGEDTQMTERALASEIREHEERLRAAETRLAQFKSENLGYMPGEAGDYYQRLQTALANVRRIEEQIRLVRERRDELQRQIEGEEPIFGIMAMNSFGATAGSSCAQSGQIADIEAQIALLRAQYTDVHPRIRALKEQIVALQEQCSAELTPGVASGRPGGAAAMPPQVLEANPVYQNLRIQLSNAEVELAQLRAELEAHEEQVAQLRRDVDKIVQVETELKQLNRDYDVVRQRHQELLKRWEDLQAKNRLDPMTDQVQFRVIEPPFAPADPVAPMRPPLLMGVFVLALGASAGLAFGLNRVNPAFFTKRSLRRFAEFPVLGSVSMVMGPELVRRRRIDTVAWVGAYALLLVLCLVVVAFAEPGSTLLRGWMQGA